MQKFLVAHTTVALNGSQGHLNWYKIIQFSVVYHLTKFERNWSVNVQMQASVKVFRRISLFFSASLCTFVSFYVHTNLIVFCAHVCTKVCFCTQGCPCVGECECGCSTESVDAHVCVCVCVHACVCVSSLSFFQSLTWFFTLNSKQSTLKMSAKWCTKLMFMSARLSAVSI